MPDGSSEVSRRSRCGEIHGMNDGDLAVRRFVSRIHDSNCYVLYPRGGGGAIVVDPGDPEPEELSGFLRDEGVRIDFVVLTHEHYDHIWGVRRLRERGDFRIIATRECSDRLGDPTRNLSAYASSDGKGTTCPRADIEIAEAEAEFDWHGRRLRFIAAPGHSPGSMLFATGALVFTGDALIPGLKTVTKLPESDKAAARDSIDRVFRNFGPETLVYPGHGACRPLGGVDRSLLL